MTGVALNAILLTALTVQNWGSNEFESHLCFNSIWLLASAFESAQIVIFAIFALMIRRQIKNNILVQKISYGYTDKYFEGFMDRIRKLLIILCIYLVMHVLQFAYALVSFIRVHVDG